MPISNHRRFNKARAGSESKARESKARESKARVSWLRWLFAATAGLLLSIQIGCANHELAPVAEYDREKVHRIRKILFPPEVLESQDRRAVDDSTQSSD